MAMKGPLRQANKCCMHCSVLNDSLSQPKTCMKSYVHVEAKGVPQKEVSDSIFVKTIPWKRDNFGLWSSSSKVLPRKERFEIGPKQAFNVLRALFGSAIRYLTFVGFSDTAFAVWRIFSKMAVERERESLLFCTLLIW